MGACRPLRRLTEIDDQDDDPAIVLCDALIGSLINSRATQTYGSGCWTLRVWPFTAKSSSSILLKSSYPPATGHSHI